MTKFTFRLANAILLVVAIVFSGTHVSSIAASGQKLANTATATTTSNPTSDVKACIRTGGTKCVVDVWERALALNPTDTTIRASLVKALIVHAGRSLDLGNMNDAKRALTRAREMSPKNSAYDSLQEAINVYDSVVTRQDWQGFTMIPPYLSSDAQVYYLPVTNADGSTVMASEITETGAGHRISRTLDYLKDVPANFAMRFQIFPKGSHGTFDLNFGGQSEDDFLAMALRWDEGSTANVFYSVHDSTGWTNFGSVIPLTLKTNRWHSVEIRMMGTSLQTWIDYRLVDTQEFPTYQAGEVGYGVELNRDGLADSFVLDIGQFVIFKLRGERGERFAGVPSSGRLAIPPPIH